MPIFSRGRYRARFAETEGDVTAAQRLRHGAFIARREGAAVNDARAHGLDADEFDSVCRHLLVEEVKTGRLVCCFRLMHLNDGSEISRTYSAKYYELSRLKDYPGPMVEMGRFCIDPAAADADVLRVAWAAMTQYVDANGVEMMFGCSSFEGVDQDAYMDAFAYLAKRHLAPKRWLPRVKAPKVFRFAKLLKPKRPDMKLAMRRMPPLLRTYLVMGGWVSDHAVIDNDLNTLHVFTGVEINRVPKTRARLLRGAVG
jgi:putative hemolysin